MAIEDRGFASMDRTRAREIASMGGKKAHALGKAHQWTKEAASIAGKKGAAVRAQQRAAAKAAAEGQA